MSAWNPCIARVRAISRLRGRVKSMTETVLGGEGVFPTYEPATIEESEGSEVDESETLGVFTWGGSRIASTCWRMIRR